MVSGQILDRRRSALDSENKYEMEARISVGIQRQDPLALTEKAINENSHKILCNSFQDPCDITNKREKKKQIGLAFLKKKMNHINILLLHK